MEMVCLNKVFEGAVGLAEGCSVTFPGTGATVLITLNKPTSEEIDNFHNGDLEYKLSIVDDVPFFLIKYGELPWMELPIVISWDNMPEPYEGTFEEGMGYMLSTIVCDVPSGVVKAMRVVGMESDVSNAINEAIKTCKKHTAITEVYAHVSSIQMKLTTDDILLKAICGGKIKAKK